MARKKQAPLSKTLAHSKKVNTFKKVAKHTDNIPVVSKARYSYRHISFFILLTIMFIAFGALTFYVKQNPHNGYDLAVTRELQLFHPTWFQILMNSVTFIGNNYNAAILTLLIGAFFFLKKRMKEGVMVIVSPLGANIISITMKNLIKRPRPDPKLIHQVGTFLHNDSFPSGHVLFFIGLFGYLLYLTYTLPPENKYRLLFIILFIILILLIGPSRIFLGAHWFSDTLGSYLIGFVWLSLVAFIYNKWIKKGRDL